MDKITLFFKDFEFFSIKNSKTPLYAMLDNRTGKIYLKGRIGFIDDIYYEMKKERYMEGKTSIIDILRFESGGKSSDRVLISAYLDNSDKIKIVDDIIFKPIEKRIFKEDGCVFLNEYTPTKYLSSEFNNGCKEETFISIKELLMNICAYDKNAYWYLMKVLSLSVRKPWIKRHGYIVFQGEGASGKGSFFELVMAPIFEKYLLVDTEECLRTNFNGYSFDKLWVFIEEKDDSQNKTKGNISSTLKTISGNQTGVSERKGFDRKIVKDYRNFGMTTNKKSNIGLNLEKNDRRATIFGYSKSLGDNIDAAPAIRLRMEKDIPKELDDFVSYLKNMEYDENEVFSSYKNEARDMLIEIDAANADHFINDIQEWSGESLETVVKDYGFLEEPDGEEINFNTKDKKVNMNIYYSDKPSDQHFYISLQTMYEMFKKFCENHDKRVLGYNKFPAEFCYGTRTKTITKTIKGKKKKLFLLKDILNYFGLTFDQNSEVYTFIEVKYK
jgi:hypothetical protein